VRASLYRLCSGPDLPLPSFLADEISSCLLLFGSLLFSLRWMNLRSGLVSFAKVSV
jgi:hypothetical protein